MDQGAQRPVNPGASESILVVEVNWLGDVLFSTPFIRAVKAAYPHSGIACLVHPRCREMLSSNPHIDRLIEYDEERIHRGPFGKARLIAEIRRENFRRAFILHRSFTKALLVLLAGVPERIGFATKRRKALLTRAVPEPPAPLHKVDYFLSLADAVGVARRGREYEFFVTDADRAAVAGLLASAGIAAGAPIAAINPGGNWGPKRWPRERFAALADRLAESGSAVVIAGAPKDAALAGEIAALMRSRPVITAGKTTLGQAGALFERAAVVVSNDSGPMHIASAVGANVVALFGPTSPAITGPCGKGAIAVIARQGGCAVPCYDRTCSSYDCMASITVDEVASAALRFLAQKR